MLVICESPTLCTALPESYSIERFCPNNREIQDPLDQLDCLVHLVSLVRRAHLEVMERSAHLEIVERRGRKESRELQVHLDHRSVTCLT